MNIQEFLKEDIDLQKSSSVSPIFYIKKYWRYWYLLLIGGLVCVGMAFVYLYYTPDQYEIQTTIMINTSGEKKGEFSNNAVLDDLEGYQSSKIIENEIEVLTSVSIMRSVLEELSLYNFYYVENGYHRFREIYGEEVPFRIEFHELSARPQSKGGMFKFIIQDHEGFIIEQENGKKSQHKFGERLKNFYGEFTVTAKPEIGDAAHREVYVSFNNVRELAFEYSDNISAESINKLATVISLSLVEAIPEKGEDILTKLVDVYNREALKNLNSTAANTLTFIDEQMASLTAELAEIELAAEKYKNEHSISDLSSESQLYLESSRTVKQQLSEYNIKAEVLNSLEENLKNDGNANKMVQSSLLIEDATLSDLVRKFNELQRERQRLLNATTPGNPIIKNLDEQLTGLKDDILDNIQSNKRSLEIAKRSLEDNAGKIERRANRVPQIERELLNITRQQATKQENYLYLMKKREESVLSLAATTISNARIIDPAMASLYPVRPLKKIVLAFSVILGFGLPIGFIYLKERFYGKIGQKSDLEALTRVPIMGEISHGRKKELTLYTPSQKTLIGEQVNLIWSNMKFATLRKPNQVILTTSSIGGEGKTFFSINLARVLSLSGKKVALLEFDLRKPALLKSLNIKTKTGITDYLRDESCPVRDVLNMSDINPNIFLVGAGHIPNNPMQVMNSPRIETLIQELKESFDYVIIDSAPIGLVADAYALSPYVDILVYMVRYYYTEPSHIKLLNEIEKHEKFKNPMVVLNDAKAEHHYAYGYGYYYGEKTGRGNGKVHVS
ncbi:GumC family protein [Negadavirga shengliensis]|uniref:non-specific protein-tyrosine kinase n=1 Tax=Negadavirga shengliensis TaxID=1389218 RepID=A0ABV9T2B9_9BACT